MKAKRQFFIALLVVAVPLLIAQVMSEERPVKTPPPKKVTIKKSINPHLQQLLLDYETEIVKLSSASRTPGAAIAVVYDSTIVYVKGFGLKSTAAQDSVDEHTVFRIASLSKCFASFLTGILVEDSVISWNDAVITFLPKFELKSKTETRKLTIGHVLSHTTGLPYHAYTNMVEEGSSLDSMLSWLKHINLASEVGQTYSYQNVAYSIIGKVIEAETGKTYEAQMVDRVFNPLNMKTASIDYASIMQNKNIAKPHKLKKRKWIPATITDTYYNVAPAGGVNASITDMAKWMVALLGNRQDIISEETLDQLYKPYVKAPSKNRNYGRLHRLSNSYYGLGWRVLHYPADTLIYHGGYVNGYRSEIAVNPKEKIAVCILANAPGELPDNGIPLFFSLFEAKRDSIIAWEARQKKMHPENTILQ